MKNELKNISAANKLQESRKNALEMFAGIEHRFELVDTISGVEIYNDSKATDAGSVLQSMELLNCPIHWIAVSSEYDEEYAILDKMVRYKVVNLSVLGESELLRDSFAHMVDQYSEFTSLEDCLINALKKAKNGDVVLFSPSCASFDRFENFRERGNAFKNEVKKLKN